MEQRGLEVKLHSFLTSALDVGGGGGGGQYHAPAGLSPWKNSGTNFRGDCVDPTDAVEGNGEEKFSCPTEVQTPARPARNESL